jgi:hypothetical protein
MKRGLCATCGAPREPGRCRYCGALEVEDVDLLAEPTFADRGWLLPADRRQYGVSIDCDRSGRELQVALPSERELGDAIVPVAWLDGMFVDVMVSVEVSFEGPPCGAAAGFWVRTRDGSAFSLMLGDGGDITLGARQDDAHLHTLAAYPRRDGTARSTRLGVTVRDYAVVVSRDGRAIGSLSTEWRFAGAVQLRAQVGSEPARLRFSDPVARLP